MSTITVARDLIDTMLNDLECGIEYTPEELMSRLVEIKSKMFRQKPVRKASPQSQPMTQELAVAIKNFARRNQDMTLQDIATRFNVNAGRVTEALRGDRW